MCDDTSKPPPPAAELAALRERIAELEAREQAYMQLTHDLHHERSLVARVMQTSPVGITVVDQTGAITFANTRAEKILGLQKDAITQRDYNDPAWRITDYDGQPFPDEQLPFRQVMRTQQPVEDVRHAIEWPDGRRTLLRINAAPLFDAQGEPTGMVATIEDVTARTIAEQARAELEQKYRNIVESMPMGMHMYQLTVDNALIFAGANPAADHSLGIDHQELLGKTIEEAFPALAETDIPARYRAAAAEGIPWRTEQITYEDERISGAFEVFAFQTAPGQMVALFQDITSRKQTEEALRHSEARARLVSELSSDYAYAVRVEPDGRRMHDWTTAGFARITGYTPDNAADYPIWPQLVHPDDMQRVQARVDRLYAGEEVTTEYRIITKDGVVRWLRDRALPIWDDEQGRVVQVYGTAQDITERKEAEQALADEHNLLTLILENLPIDVYMKDRESRFVYANAATMRSLNVTTMEAYFGKTDFDFMPQKPDEAATRFAEEQHIMQTGEPLLNNEQTGPDEHGARCWSLTSKLPIQDAAGNVTGLLGIGMDITSHRQAEIHRVALAEEQARVQVLADFINTAAHELRTPLSVINAALYLLSRLEDPDQRAAKMQVLKEQTTYLSGLIDAMLTMSRLDSAAEFAFAPLSLNALVKEAATSVHSLAQAKALTLTVEPQEPLPPLSGDRRQLQRAVANIIRNAVQYTPAGGRVTARTRHDGQAVIVEVEDTGVGIAADDLPRIFEHFYRVDQARSTRGAGLGLAIAHRIVEVHGGDITVESVVGAGSTFRVILPLDGAQDV